VQLEGPDGIDERQLHGAADRLQITKTGSVWAVLGAARLTQTRAFWRSKLRRSMLPSGALSFRGAGRSADGTNRRGFGR